MTRLLGAGAVGVVLAAVACTPADEPPPRAEATPPASETQTAALEGPGWTGLTEPEEVIEARRLLMREAERLMKPVDEYAIGGPGDAAALRSAGTTLEPLLLALPHLFPPTTNLFDPAAHDPPTIALPTIRKPRSALPRLLRRPRTASPCAPRALACAPRATPVTRGS
jgi:hypothetical protein